MEIIIDSALWLWRLQDLMHVKNLAQCPTWKEYSIHASLMMMMMMNAIVYAVLLQKLSSPVSFWKNSSYPPSLVFSQICPFIRCFFIPSNQIPFFPPLNSHLLTFLLERNLFPTATPSHPNSRTVIQIPRQSLKVKADALLIFVSPAVSTRITRKILKWPFNW